MFILKKIFVLCAKPYAFHNYSDVPFVSKNGVTVKFPSANTNFNARVLASVAEFAQVILLSNQVANTVNVRPLFETVPIWLPAGLKSNEPLATVPYPVPSAATISFLVVPYTGITCFNPMKLPEKTLVESVKTK